MKILLLSAIAALALVARAKADHTYVYAYYNATHDDHFYTTDYSELGSGGSGYSYWTSDGFYLYDTSYSTSDDGNSLVSWYRYYNSGNHLHYYTTNWSELGSGALGYTYEKTQAMLPTTSGTYDSHEFDEYVNSTTGGHWYRISADTTAPGSGWSFNNVEGYAGQSGF